MGSKKCPNERSLVTDRFVCNSKCRGYLQGIINETTTQALKLELPYEYTMDSCPYMYQRFREAHTQVGEVVPARD